MRSQHRKLRPNGQSLMEETEGANANANCYCTPTLKLSLKLTNKQTTTKNYVTCCAMLQYNVQCNVRSMSGNV